MKKEITVKYWHGDTVFLRMRTERMMGMITGVQVRPTHLIYIVTWGSGTESYHSEIELSSTFLQEWEHEAAAKEESK